MKATILLPTYNRAHLIRMQLPTLQRLRLALEEFEINLEVIISDNWSEPAVTVPPEFKHFVKLVRPDTHLNSGEANILSAIHKCDGEYIWTLGDDDSPVVDNVVSLFRAITERRPDFVVTNSAAYLNTGEIIKPQIIGSQPHKFSRLPDFIASAGIWFVLAGFSGLIARTDVTLAQIDKFRNYNQASKVYSYAMFLVDAFWDKNFMFFGSPCVVAAQNEYGSQWDNMAAKEGVFSQYFWTLGFIKQANILKSSREIRSGFFSRIIEQTPQRRFHLLSQICLSTLCQLQSQKERTSVAIDMTDDELESISDFLCAEEPILMQVLAPLIKGHDLNLLSIDEIKRAMAATTVLKDRYYEFFFVKRVAGWNIYFFDGVFRAVPAGYEKNFLEVFRDIAPPSSRWHIVAYSVEEIERAISASPYPSITEVDVKRIIEDAEARVRAIVDEAITSLAALVPQPITMPAQAAPAKPDPEYASPLGLILPPRLSLELGKFLCTIGLKKIGSRFL
jgi:hypothetical protein